MAPKTYLNFDIHFNQLGEKYEAHVINSPAGEAKSIFNPSLSEKELTKVLSDVNLRRGIARKSKLPNILRNIESYRDRAKALGDLLYKTVFSNELRRCLRESLDEADRKKAGLRIRLHLAKAPELAILPWEYLYQKEVDRFPSHSIYTPIVRCLGLSEPKQSLAVKPPIKILVMISNPNDRERWRWLDVDQEWASLRKALDRLLKRKLVKLEKIENATPSELLRWLSKKEEYHIFHFIGHGEFDAIIMEDEGGKGNPVSGEDLGTILHDHRSLRLAVLNACEGARSSCNDSFAGTAPRLVQQGIPAVIAMQFKVSDPVAIDFASRFYEALLVDTYPVDAALAEARKVIYVQDKNNIEWGTPVLYMHSTDGRIFDIERKIFNLPNRNAKFTGRNELLNEIRSLLTLGKTDAPIKIALYGLGGVGKTQVVLEYAYRYAREYKFIRWLRANAPSSLKADYVALARELDLPVKNDRDQNLIIESVQYRLKEIDKPWLLIFDDAQDPRDIFALLPQSTATTGHVLITSRYKNWNEETDFTLPIKEFERNESVEFLCKFTNKADQVNAEALAEALGDLPLALKHAGGACDAGGLSLGGYLQLYRKRHKKLLKVGKPRDYHDTLETAWEISFQKLKKESPASATLLNLCAFLAPDKISKSLLTSGKEHLPKSLAKKIADETFHFELIQPLLHNSLIESQDDNNLSIHPVVQNVLWHRLSKQARKKWTEVCIRLVDNSFPYGNNDPWDERFWDECERLLPHALKVTKYAEAEQIALEVVAHLSRQSGKYLQGRFRFDEAEPLLCKALEIREKQLGVEHSDVAQSMDDLGGLFQDQGKYAKAQPLICRALEIREKQLDSEPLKAAESFDHLAGLLQDQGKYTEAAPLYSRALAIREKQLGPEHLDVAESLDHLAGLLQDQSKHAEAIWQYSRALEIRAKQLPLDHLDVGQSIANLAGSLQDMDKYAEAKRLYCRALAIHKKKLGKNNPHVATCLNNLADLLGKQSIYKKRVDKLYCWALKIYKENLGSNHPLFANTLLNRAKWLRDQQKYDEAKEFYNEARGIYEKHGYTDHPEFATILTGLAELHGTRGEYAEAELLARRALEICEKRLGKDHEYTKKAYENYKKIRNQHIDPQGT